MKKRNDTYRSVRDERQYGPYWYNVLWRIVRPVLVAAGSLLVVVGILSSIWNQVYEEYLAPANTEDHTQIAFNVESGQSLTRVANNLEAAGLIRNRTVFKYYCDFAGMGQKIQSGAYVLTPSMTMSQIAEQLTMGDGNPIVRNITLIPGWTIEEFAAKLDQILAQFIKVYQPAYFERIGLRYINAISRSALGLEEVPFSDLIEPAYLGLLASEDVSERAFTRAWQEAEVNLPGGCRLKLRCGPGRAMRPGQQNSNDKEIRFIFDQDIFMAGNIEMKHSAGALNTIHIHADRTFRGAITDMLHNAMEPTVI